jgi:hypothetical protein
VAHTLTTELGEQERRFRLLIHDRETKLTVPTQVSQPGQTHRDRALGRVIHGSNELTDGIDVVPATNKTNLRRLVLATLRPRDARRPCTNSLPSKAS